VFHRFVEALPGVSIDIDIASPALVDQSVLEGKVDLGINSSPRRTRNLRYHDLKGEVVGLYCGAGHPLFARPQGGLTPDEVLEHEIIRAHGYRYPRRIVRALRGDRSSSCIPLDGRLLLVLTGRFLGFLTEDCAKPHVDRGELREMLPRDFRYDTTLALMSRVDAEEPTVLKFLEILEEELHRPLERAARAI
jgi:DNA-binding transcriptional LysR family regulator